MKCRVEGCDQEGTDTLLVRYTTSTDPMDASKTAQREERLELCPDHIEAVKSGTGSFSFDSPVVRGFTLGHESDKGTDRASSVPAEPAE